LSVPIFDRSMTKGNVQKSQIQLANERLNLEDVRQTVSMEVRQALLAYQTAAEQLKVAVAQRGYARQALDVTEERYHVGSAILVELTQSRAQYVSANNDWVKANYNLLLSRVALDNAKGELDETSSLFQ